MWSHLCEALLLRGDEVVCVDDMSTGRPSNIAGLMGSGSFTFVEADVSKPLAVEGDFEAVLHLASPASPPEYLARPLATLAVGSEGTRNAIEIAARCGAKFLLASTSEVYGEPTVHPQVETYWGNVNCVGPRSVYDEAKRFAEALTFAWHRTQGLRVTVVRLFNTYGPRLAPGDGRVVSNFIAQALRGEPFSVYGNGTQTRSLCFVDDTIRAIVAAVDSDTPGPVNIGNPNEVTVLELARMICKVVGCDEQVVYLPLPQDDPTRRCPDITLARREFDWAPQVSLEDGLRLTARYLAEELGERRIGDGPKIKDVK